VRTSQCSLGPLQDRGHQGCHDLTRAGLQPEPKTLNRGTTAHVVSHRVLGPVPAHGGLLFLSWSPYPVPLRIIPLPGSSPVGSSLSPEHLLHQESHTQHRPLGDVSSPEMRAERGCPDHRDASGLCHCTQRVPSLEGSELQRPKGW
jgi:hypothetical protein